MTLEEIVSEHGYEISALEWLVAAALARTFNTEAELRAWGDAAVKTVLSVVERRPGQLQPQAYREAFDRILAIAVTDFAAYRANDR